MTDFQIVMATIILFIIGASPLVVAYAIKELVEYFDIRREIMEEEKRKESEEK